MVNEILSGPAAVLDEHGYSATNPRRGKKDDVSIQRPHGSSLRATGRYQLIQSVREYGRPDDGLDADDADSARIPEHVNNRSGVM